MNPVTFTSWLSQSFQLITSRPLVWLGYTFICSFILIIVRISLALGIFLCVLSLFFGVGLAGYYDDEGGERLFPNLRAAITNTLPLAIIAAAAIMLFWFLFRIGASIYANDLDKIGQFFFYWELTPQNLLGKSLRQVTDWLYSGAKVALVFMLLILTTHATWFSFPLMLFKNYKWSEAKILGEETLTIYAKVFYQLVAFMMVLTFIGAGIEPLITPFLYVWLSTLIYVSYRDVFSYL